MCEYCRQTPHHRQCPNAIGGELEVCEFCKATFDGTNITVKDGHCTECWDDWLQDSYTFADVDEYVKCNQKAFYLEFWFERLSAEERKDIARKAFEEREKTGAYFTKAGVKSMTDFCFDDQRDFYKFKTKG